MAHGKDHLKYIFLVVSGGINVTDACEDDGVIYLHLSQYVHKKFLCQVGVLLNSTKNDKGLLIGVLITAKYHKGLDNPKPNPILTLALT